MKRPISRIAALSASLVMVLAVPGFAHATAQGPSGAPATAGAADTNPWLHRRVLNMAHSGGENEAPMNTMYAFKRAVALGADMIELDVESTADNQLVVIHNSAVDETTNGTGLVSDMTLRQVQALDAAYNFVPDRSAVPGLPPSSYPLRGVRTHDQRPPRGYRASDFAIPTLREVLCAFPHVPINIEIKGTSDTDLASFQHNATLLAQLLNATGRTDVIVVSANDAALATFHALAPQISLAPGLQGLTAYYFGGVRPIDGTVALQIPVQYSGVRLATPEFIARAHADGYAVHVWFSGTAPDDAATYNSIIDMCADGLMPAYPTLLEHILDERHIVRPGTPGIDPCAH
jgi:glycerophosphoryl diester phosphodiesterase